MNGNINNYDFKITGLGTPSRDIPLAFSTLMRKVYTWMALALVITGLTAYGVASSPNMIATIYGNSAIVWGMLIAELALVFGVSRFIDRLSLGTATLMFVAYSVLNGAVLSSIFLIYTQALIAKVFFITAGTFAAMAIYGHTTKTDLTSMGKILIMALIGIIIATIVNLFVKSSGFDLILSYIGVIVFVGLTAYDSQKIKHMLLAYGDTGEQGQKLALMGSLTLYLDFIDLFIYLLRIFGGRSDD